jgi:hypothetical protein
MATHEIDSLRHARNLRRKVTNLWSEGRIGDGSPNRVTTMLWNMPVEETEAVKVARAIRIVLGQHLQQCYSDVLRDPLPPDIAARLQQLDDSSAPAAEKIRCASGRSAPGVFKRSVRAPKRTRQPVAMAPPTERSSSSTAPHAAGHGPIRPSALRRLDRPSSLSPLKLTEHQQHSPFDRE